MEGGIVVRIDEPNDDDGVGGQTHTDSQQVGGGGDDK